MSCDWSNNELWLVGLYLWAWKVSSSTLSLTSVKRSDCWRISRLECLFCSQVPYSTSDPDILTLHWSQIVQWTTDQKSSFMITKRFNTKNCSFHQKKLFWQHFLLNCPDAEILSQVWCLSWWCQVTLISAVSNQRILEYPDTAFSSAILNCVLVYY